MDKGVMMLWLLNLEFKGVYLYEDNTCMSFCDGEEMKDEVEQYDEMGYTIVYDSKTNNETVIGVYEGMTEICRWTAIVG